MFTPKTFQGLAIFINNCTWLSFSYDKLFSPHISCRTSLALMVYRETVAAGVIPTMEVLSQVLGCLQFPHDGSLRNRLIENLGVTADTSRRPNLCSLIDGFGEYDSRAFSLLEVGLLLK